MTLKVAKVAGTGLPTVSATVSTVSGTQRELPFNSCQISGSGFSGGRRLGWSDHGYWYGQVTVTDVPEIVEEHLIKGRVVERLALLRVPTNFVSV